MAKSIDYRPWIFFTILGAILITVLVIIGKRENYAYRGRAYYNDDDDLEEGFGYQQGAKYATSACINRFSNYYNNDPQLSNLL